MRLRSFHADVFTSLLLAGGSLVAMMFYLGRCGKCWALKMVEDKLSSYKFHTSIVSDFAWKNPFCGVQRTGDDASVLSPHIGMRHVNNSLITLSISFLQIRRLAGRLMLESNAEILVLVLCSPAAHGVGLIVLGASLVLIDAIVHRQLEHLLGKLVILDSSI